MKTNIIILLFIGLLLVSFTKSQDVTPASDDNVPANLSMA